METKKKKVVVTGAAGFIGSHLSDALVQEGFEVHSIDIRPAPKSYANKDVVYHENDIRDLAAISAIIKGAEFVFHLAALPRVQYSIEHPIETNEVNVGGTVSVLTAAVNGGVRRVIYSASSSAYGDQPVLPLVEKMSAHPKSPYGLQKYVGELYAQVWTEIHKIETVSLRYFNVYGPRMNNEGAYALVIGKFLQQRISGKPMTITGDGEQTRDFTHVSDVVRANILAAKSEKVGKGEVLNIGAGNDFSVNAVAKLIGGPAEHIAPRLEPRHTRADNTLARELLGWKPEVSFEKGIAELKQINKL
ncbi:MAG: hypothetical protein A2664_04425 [Candidatus Taylorbacteria bacterium RIFCSPHIGHO2_01_FULL_46_22b]|uniref:NAD-dependent epimerase/dehydratase domain-containing protein n=1 Tax=Candidatus Taylorbacteria bacterium RIFCSPHIGHO2_01_FULL_46_22b TaxID=1802301 RepID=A0A1G2M4C5_9BACT|nr:MAG: hypothetical protein A2664_04425 [Candidatus Taylorbacteria bacterium RIFCSPHIGHO2_01_FULL_46_22b]